MNTKRNFNKGGRFRDKSQRFGGSDGRFGGNRNFDRPRMHPAVCSSCGKDCEVPFMPTGNKPVYCSNCYSKSNDRYSEGGSNSQRQSSAPAVVGLNREELEREFERLNVKLNEIQRLLTSLTMKGANPIKKKIPINTKDKKVKKTKQTKKKA